MLIETRLDLEEVTREELQALLDGTPADARFEARIELDRWRDHWRIEVVELKSLWGTNGVFLSASVDLDGITREQFEEFLAVSEDGATFFVELMVVDRTIGRPLTVDPVSAVFVASWERESAADD